MKPTDRQRLELLVRKAEAYCNSIGFGDGFEAARGEFHRELLAASACIRATGEGVAPVSEAWLRAGGWEQDGFASPVWVWCTPDLIPAFTVVLRPGEERHAGYLGEFGTRPVPWPDDICSREQLRLICAALGSPLNN